MSCCGEGATLTLASMLVTLKNVYRWTDSDFLNWQEQDGDLEWERHVARRPRLYDWEVGA